MSNRLKNETSPYLLAHKDNPVDWYPWCDEAFERAEKEDKPIFLSIGYSACHWCHVMAHESFEDEEIAQILNRKFISIKVDKEERPDIDSVYMAVCQAFTGNGGWPTSIFMTPQQKPFFAGTYFPKTTRGAMIGLKELLVTIYDNWQNDRESLLRQSDKILDFLKEEVGSLQSADIELADKAVEIYKRIFDEKNAGFGRAPKFPTPHNILFLLSYFERYKIKESLEMAEKTLLQMYRGGMFDHIGFGFCRYSTDKKFLVPHFEKMLYDNALLIISYCKAYSVTKKEIYLKIAEKIGRYILREMTSPEGGFFSSQDADSEGEEGKYYLFTPDEIENVLGKIKAREFCRRFDITDMGNFEGKNIPNLLQGAPLDDSLFEDMLPPLYRYRKNRYSLQLDDKIITSWNSLMIAAMCELYLVSKKETYLSAAKRADEFIQNRLCESDTLFVSYREGVRAVKGFLDDYAAYAFANLSLYNVTLNEMYLERTMSLCQKVEADFKDNSGGYYLYSHNSEQLILRPKETYDGATPSGNSLMAYNYARLSLLTSQEKYRTLAERQLDFLASEAVQYPTNYAMFLTALMDFLNPPLKITVVLAENLDAAGLREALPQKAAVFVVPKQTEQWQLKNGKTTYYVCRGHSCAAPQNDIKEILEQCDF